MKHLLLFFGLILFSCGDSTSKFDLQKNEMIANESARWFTMAEPKDFVFYVVNDSTFTMSSKFVHPILAKEVRFTYTYSYNSSLDSLKKNKLSKQELLVEGTLNKYVDRE